jgi:hypothetical protein
VDERQRAFDEWTRGLVETLLTALQAEAASASIALLPGRRAGDLDLQPLVDVRAPCATSLALAARASQR